MNEPLVFFRRAFRALTGHSAFLWQERLFERFMEGNLPDQVEAPTSVGKTNVVAVWVIALAYQQIAGTLLIPRHLVYVINRRIVVDQATEIALRVRTVMNSDVPEASELRGALRSMSIDPDDRGETIAISTLRGELADNREWQADPSKPSIIVGTVDMIGSKMLFQGYGTSWKFRAHVAGLLCQDTLLVLDEPQLAHAFVVVARRISSETGGSLRTLEMSATPHGCAEKTFQLNEQELAEDRVRQRVRAHKSLHLHMSDDVVEDIIERALGFKDGRVRVGIYVQTPEDAGKVHGALIKALKDGQRVNLLTGTLRCHERDNLANSLPFLPFLAEVNRGEIPETLYTVATSAGESGINLDFDHVVCDLTTLDSMVQRAGRDNRLGQRVASEIHVFVDAERDGLPIRPRDLRRRATREALQRLPIHNDGSLDASPMALVSILDAATRETAYEAPNRTLPLTDIILDHLALTSIRVPFGGRPYIDPFLHGVEGHEPETIVAWREEVPHLVGLLDNHQEGAVKEWLDAHPLRTQEQLKEKSDRATKQLRELAKGRPIVAVLVGAQRVRPMSLDKLGDSDLEGVTILLPADAGGLDPSGMLSGKAKHPVPDVADWTRSNFRARLLIEDSGVHLLGQRNDPIELPDPSSGLEETVGAVLRSLQAVERWRIVLRQSSEEGCSTSVLLSVGAAKSVDTALDMSAEAAMKQTLPDHLRWTSQVAERLVRHLGLDKNLAEAVVLAAAEHDRGKARRVWQEAIGNKNPDAPLAKSGHQRFDNSILQNYRHEFGSLLDVAELVHGHPERELILHLIATHHGRARPHFTTSEYDREATLPRCEEEASEVMRRYARLQRRFGRWGLAWLESLMKTADVIASRRGQEVEGLPQ